MSSEVSLPMTLFAQEGQEEKGREEKEMRKVTRYFFRRLFAYPLRESVMIMDWVFGRGRKQVETKTKRGGAG